MTLTYSNRICKLENMAVYYSVIIRNTLHLYNKVKRDAPYQQFVLTDLF